MCAYYLPTTCAAAGSMTEGTIYQRGASFFSGCVIAVIGNLSLCLIFGIKGRQVSHRKMHIIHSLPCCGDRCKGKHLCEFDITDVIEKQENAPINPAIKSFLCLCVPTQQTTAGVLRFQATVLSVITHCDCALTLAGTKAAGVYDQF